MEQARRSFKKAMIIQYKHVAWAWAWAYIPDWKKMNDYSVSNRSKYRNTSKNLNKTEKLLTISFTEDSFCRSILVLKPTIFEENPFKIKLWLHS